MNGSTTNITIRMDANLKAQAEALFNEFGMNLSTAFNILSVNLCVKGLFLLKFILKSLMPKLLPLWKKLNELQMTLL